MDLAELINSARGDRSYRQLAEQSEKIGLPITSSTWQQLGSGTRKRTNIPDRPTLQSVSRVLGVPERAVLFAAAESVGIDLSDGRSPLHNLLPAGVSRLTDRQVLAILAVIQSFLDPGLPDPATDVDEFVLPDVTAPEPPHEPTAAQRAARQRRAGHEA